jgi:molybdate/tungstate transport system ATP-binding protein
VIALENVSIRAGEFALNDISFTVPAGSWCVFMGRTGSGKTTILEIICGLRPSQSGRITIGGEDVTELPPRERGIAYVPQDRALFHTMTVRENLAFALKLRRWARERIDARVAELAELLKITPLLDRFPQKLSGGEAQRVALGRGLAAKPAVLCLDEPLSALDDATRDEMRAVLRSVREHTQVTTLHVTHHADDARGLADQLLFVRDGRIVPGNIDDLRR